MASRIEGLAVLDSKIKSFDAVLREYLESRIGDEVEAMRQHAADLVPVDTGEGRAVLLMPDAIKVSNNRTTGARTWTFGFNTGEMKKRGFHLYWVEFGTKGYRSGETRRAGTDKRGRVGRRRIKRNIPARPAQPFFRPAVANFTVRMRQHRTLAKIFAAAATAAGLNHRV